MCNIIRDTQGKWGEENASCAEGKWQKTLSDGW